MFDFNFITLILWGLLLIVQNASFTMVSRARNSGSDWYHGIASVFSNGIWFAAFYITFDYLSRVRESGSVMAGVFIAVVYITATVTGSVTMGKFLRRFVEKGNRKVGAYGKGEGVEKAKKTPKTGDQMLLMGGPGADGTWAEVTCIIATGEPACVVRDRMFIVSAYETETMVKPVDGVSYWRQVAHPSNSSVII